MQKIDFNDAVESVASNDSRYAGDAYYFLQEVLTQAVNKQRKDTGGEDRHVNGEELLKVFRVRAKKNSDQWLYRYLKSGELDLVRMSGK